MNISENIKVIILIGARDFGRCPTATRLNRALWPFAGKPVLQHLMDGLSAQGIRRFALCCERYGRQTRQLLKFQPDWQIQFLEETMPRGTAGCLKDAASPSDKLLLVFSACTLRAPNLQQVIDLHHAAKSPMTAFFRRTDCAQHLLARDLQFYVCDISVLSHIPAAGYADIKETLTPVLLAEGIPLKALETADDCGVYRSWDGFLLAATRQIERWKQNQVIPDGFYPLDGQTDIWIQSPPQIGKNVCLEGPVLIGKGVTIQDGAVIIGPTIIENDVCIGQNACLEQTVIWPRAVIRPDCYLQQTLVDECQKVPARSDLRQKLIPKQPTIFRSFCQAAQLSLWGRKVFDRTALTLADFLAGNRKALGILLLFVAALIALCGAYWNPTLKELVKIWLESDEYSSGMLVPLLAAYAFWYRRSRFTDVPLKADFLGLFLILFAQIVRLFGQYYLFASAQRAGWVLSIGGLFWTFFGFKAFRKFIPIFAFLFLMLPLPNRVERWITLPLQEYATASAVFCLEVLGYQPVRQGNIIEIGQTMVAIAEACNGLRMVTAFFVISGFVILISQRKRWEKMVLLILTLPIALVCNTIRLTATSIVFTFVSSKEWEMFFHDFGGIMMIPLAVGLIVLILWLLKILFHPPSIAEPAAVYRRNKQ